MDIAYKSEQGEFTLRAAALIINGNRLLLVKNDKYDCYYTVGGRVRQNEASQSAAIRECYEETGRRLEIDRLVFVQERFFEANGARHHEIVFFYLMKHINCDIEGGANTDLQSERLIWAPVEKLETLNLYPPFLAPALRRIPNEITHILSYE